MARRIPGEMKAAHDIRALGIPISLCDLAENLHAIARDDLLLLAECSAALAASASMGGRRFE